MGAVLAEQERAPNKQEADQDQSCARRQKTRHDVALFGQLRSMASGIAHELLSLVGFFTAFGFFAFVACAAG